MASERARALLSTTQLARELGVSESTLRRWRFDGDGPRFVKVGRQVRYDPRDVSAYLRDR